MSGRIKYQLTILQSLDRAKSSLQLSRDLRLNFWQAGGLYSQLHQLEKNGLITSYYDEARPPERGFNRSRYYCLTRLGKSLLEESVQERK